MLHCGAGQAALWLSFTVCARASVERRLQLTRRLQMHSPINMSHP